MRIALLLTFAALAMSCGSAPRAHSAADAPVLAKLQTREHLIELVGADGVRVLDRDGRELVATTSRESLRETHPELSVYVDEAYALMVGSQAATPVRADLHPDEWQPGAWSPDLWSEAAPTEVR
ncbi:MAG: hypothetical protein AAF605_04250 [Myxococcota bacterium]